MPVVRCLLEAGADARARDSTGQNMLHIVARRCVDSLYVTQLVALLDARKELAGLLVANNNAGQTPLGVALSRGVRELGTYRKRMSNRKLSTVQERACKEVTPALAGPQCRVSGLETTVRLFYLHSPRVNFTFWDNGPGTFSYYFHSNVQLCNASNKYQWSAFEWRRTRDIGLNTQQLTLTEKPRTIRYLPMMPYREISQYWSPELTRRWKAVRDECEFLGDLWDATACADTDRIRDIISASTSSPEEQLQLCIACNDYNNNSKLSSCMRCQFAPTAQSTACSKTNTDESTITGVFEPGKRKHNNHWNVLHEAVCQQSTHDALASLYALADALDPDVLVLLMKQPEADLQRTPLMIAASNGSLEVVTAFLAVVRKRQGGVEPLVHALLIQRDCFERNAAMIALSRNHQGVARVLLDACPASQYRPDKLGRTVLYYACAGGFLDITRQLLEQDETCRWLQGLFVSLKIT